MKFQLSKIVRSFFNANFFKLSKNMSPIIFIQNKPFKIFGQLKSNDGVETTLQSTNDFKAYIFCNLSQ